MFDSACFIPLFVFPFLSGNKLTDWANVCATLRNFLYIYFVHFCLFGICYGITNIADVLKKNLTEKVWTKMEFSALRFHFIFSPPTSQRNPFARRKHSDGVSATDLQSTIICRSISHHSPVVWRLLAASRLMVKAYWLKADRKEMRQDYNCFIFCLTHLSYNGVTFFLHSCILLFI